MTAPSATHTCTSLTIVLIKPSKYDDDGYVVRYRKGFLPSNTLACLAALTEDVRRGGELGAQLRWDIRLFDDTVQEIPLRSIVRASRRKGNKTVVCLVGVQTNQFPRAADLALAFRRHGLDVLIGGFHVSGSMAMLPKAPAEIQQLMDAGVTVVLGEVEDSWGGILGDIARGTRKPVYDFLEAPPSLAHRPLPVLDREYLRHFMTSNFGTIDASRGCPFHCTFCTIINVQGRRMRCRDAETLVEGIRQNYAERGVSFYFFTDDNFSRNRNWEAIFDGLIRLREEEHIPIEFMMQADVLSYRIPQFVRKARQAGCSQVFLGMESLNPDNLRAAGKTQNDVHDLIHMVEAYHGMDIMTHAAYIVGFPWDTPESVRGDIDRLKHELRVKQASFFMLTPLPGSADHAEAVSRGVTLDPDLSHYDAFHPTMPHPRMSTGEWARAYDDAWRSFYSFENMRDILENTTAARYWNVFKNFIWSKSAIAIEHQHPMVSGFFRLKPRLSRRPGLATVSWLAHRRAMVRETLRKAKAWWELMLEMEELWLQTRKRGVREQLIVEEIRALREDVREWRELKTHELQVVYRRATARLRAMQLEVRVRERVPSRFTLLMKKANILTDRIAYSRHSLKLFWTETWHNLVRGRIHRIHPHRVAVSLVRDLALTIQFAAAMFASGFR